MFYYVKDDICIAKSEVRLKTSDWIKEIKNDILFKKPFIENWKIIEFHESKKHRKEKEELFLLENKEKIDDLKNQWYEVKIENFEIIKIKTPEYFKKIQLKDKQKDIQKFKELLKKWLDNDKIFDSLNKIPIELNPDKEIELQILRDKWEVLTTELLTLKSQLIEKYWENIRAELI